MKELFLFSFFLLFANNIFAQDTLSVEDNQIYNVSGIDVKPEFPGGIQEFFKYISKNYKVYQKGLKGKVYTSFIIDKDGSLTDIKIIKDIGYDTGKEARRVLEECPKWNPGKQKGEMVRVLYAFPISIQPR